MAAKLSRPHHDSQLGVPIVLDDATVEFSLLPMLHATFQITILFMHTARLSIVSPYQRDTLHKLEDQCLICFQLML